MATWVNITTAIHKEFQQVQQSSNALKTYQTYINRCTKIWSEFLENALLVGQLQLIRNLIAFHLNKSCKFNAKSLESSLRSLNKSVISIHKIFEYFYCLFLFLELCCWTFPMINIIQVRNYCWTYQVISIMLVWMNHSTKFIVHLRIVQIIQLLCLYLL